MTVRNVPFGAYRPDQPAAPVIDGVVPVPEGGYGPLPSLVGLIAALPDPCQGAASLAGADGTLYTVAATGAGVYTVDPTTDGWRSVGAFPSSRPWRFAGFQDLVFAADGVDPILCGDRFGDFHTIDGAPVADGVVRVRDWLFWWKGEVVGWSAMGNPLVYPAVGSTLARQVGADQSPLSSLGTIQTIVGGPLANADALILTDRAALRVGLTGGDAVFAFQVIAGAHGTDTPNGVVVIDGTAFYHASTGFVACDGAGETPIGVGVVDRSFAADCRDTGRTQVVAAAWPGRHTAMWLYPTAAGMPDHRVLIFEGLSKRWAVAPAAGIGWLLTAPQSWPVAIEDIQIPTDGPYLATNDLIPITVSDLKILVEPRA